MKKSMSMILASVVVAGLSLSAAAFACDSHATKASTEGSTAIMKVSDGGSCATKASTASAGCGMKSSMASLLKSAPGTKMSYQKVDGGIALVVTAASKEYVPVVQQAIATRLDDMKVMTAHATKVSSGSSCCAAKASTASMTEGASCATKTSAVKVSDGAGCATKSTAATTSAGATVTTVSTESCPDWMKVLCTANCQVENTATGVKVMWTTTEKAKIEQVQMAGEQLHADLAS